MCFLVTLVVLVIKELKSPQEKILTSRTEALLSQTGIYMLCENPNVLETIEDDWNIWINLSSRTQLSLETQ